MIHVQFIKTLYSAAPDSFKTTVSTTVNMFVCLWKLNVKASFHVSVSFVLKPNRRHGSRRHVTRWTQSGQKTIFAQLIPPKVQTDLPMPPMIRYRRSQTANKQLCDICLCFNQTNMMMIYIIHQKNLSNITELNLSNSNIQTSLHENINSCYLNGHTDLIMWR